MSKFGALLLVIIILGLVFYVYNTNINDVGVKIEKLKLKYTIGENASAEKILLFSEDLMQLAENSKDKDKKRLVFESKLWYAAGTAKKVAEILGTGENFTDNCADEMKEIKKQIESAKKSLAEAKEEFDLIKDLYTTVEQKDFAVRFSNVEYSLTTSENIAYIFCP